MSIDNNAVLYVGLPFRELDPECVYSKPCFLLESVEDDCLGYYPLDDQHDEGILIGYLIGDSGSHGIKVIEDINFKIAYAISDFESHFKKKPKVYLFNSQS